MKNSILRILALASMLCILLCACNSDGGETNTTSVTTTPPTAREQLTSHESDVFEALIKMITADFFEPSAVRILELGEYTTSTFVFDDDTKVDYDVPHTVVVRLQGENRVGGTLNHYYRVCVVAGEGTSDTAKEQIRYYEEYGWGSEYILKYKADVGDYVNLGDTYELQESYRGVEYDIGRINKALAEYWEDMGF